LAQNKKTPARSDRYTSSADNLVAKSMNLLGTPVLLLALVLFVLFILYGNSSTTANIIAGIMFAAFLLSFYFRSKQKPKTGLKVVLLTLWIGFNANCLLFFPYFSLSLIALVIVIFTTSLMLPRGWSMTMSGLMLVLHFGFYYLLWSGAPFIIEQPDVQLVHVVSFNIFVIISLVIGSMFQETLVETLEQTEKNHALFHTVVDQFESAVLIVDPNLVVEEINHSAVRLLDVPYNKAIGKSIYAILRNDLREQAKQIAKETFKESNVSGVKIETENKDGEPLYLSISVQLLHPNEQTSAYFMISITDETSHKLTEQQIQQLAFIDHLTGVENRLSFNYKITSLINTMSQSEGHFHLVYFDLDQFKSINDEYGHTAGDKVLVEFTKRLANVTRGEDFIARVGGDEFIMLMENLPSEKHLEHALSRLRVALNMPYQVEEGPLALSVSLGVSQFLTDGDDAETLLKKADDAMYQEKFNSSA